jgi:hypothetical protein
VSVTGGSGIDCAWATNAKILPDEMYIILNNYHKLLRIRAPFSSITLLHRQGISLIRLRICTNVILSHSAWIAALNSATVCQVPPRKRDLIICQSDSIGFRSGLCGGWIRILRSASLLSFAHGLFFELLPCEGSPSS